MRTRTTAFDADTALEPAGERRWRAEVSERWFVGRGPNGGLLAAMAVRAMEALADDPERVPRSLTIHFLEAPAAGPIDIAGTVERVGRSTSALSLRFEQGGRPVALALGAVAVWRDGAFEHSASAPPAIPRPEALPATTVADMPGAPPFMANYDWRWATPEPNGTGARVGGWIRVPEPRPVDHVSLAAYADAFPPAVFPLFGDDVPGAPTIDLTVHFRAALGAASQAAEASPTGRAALGAASQAAAWVLGVFHSRRVAGGFFEEDGELWSEEGVLLAQSRQLAMLRERRP